MVKGGAKLDKDLQLCDGCDDWTKSDDLKMVLSWTRYHYYMQCKSCAKKGDA